MSCNIPIARKEKPKKLEIMAQPFNLKIKII
jgi:hypothetical protein